MGIVVYGLAPRMCQACDLVVGILQDRGLPFRYVDINTSEEIAAKFGELHDKVPQIYLDGVYQGGAMEAYRVGELE